ncbi:hypothetical protein BDQ12DRAFT_332090 [Crucibulum laeve]|uniref:Uncharacterized protein n=1 Tax=Crucibulum laeve TaxID=68775 RepID=A0A5C3LPW4_9AGAR|nr:hypothetical protein BDQ12DRAFT_332090 [Crucibulum laeve]
MFTSEAERWSNLSLIYNVRRARNKESIDGLLSRNLTYALRGMAEGDCRLARVGAVTPFSGLNCFNALTTAASGALGIAAEETAATKSARTTRVRRAVYILTTVGGCPARMLDAAELSVLDAFPPGFIMSFQALSSHGK